MVRIWTLTGLGLAMAFGATALAQHTSGAASTSGGTAAEAGAPASEEIGIKGVYSTKRTMGISTGQSAPAKADVQEEEDEASAEAEGDEDGQPASN